MTNVIMFYVGDNAGHKYRGGIGFKSVIIIEKSGYVGVGFIS